MRYLGGKQRISKYLIPFLQNETIHIFVDGFCGGLNIMPYIKANKRIAFDVNLPLISLYKALQNRSIELPNIITEQEYKEAKLLDDINPLKAFIGFGCSFSGKYFGGMCKDNTERNYTLNAKNSLLKTFKNITINDEFICCNYKDFNIKNATIYLDPPYENTTKYSEYINHLEFWEWCRNLAKMNKVFISEYNAPSDFKCVLEIETKTEIRTKLNGREKRIEKLFTI